MHIFKRWQEKKTTLSFKEIRMFSYQRAERGKEGRLTPSTSSSSLHVWTDWLTLNSLLPFSCPSWTLRFPRMPRQRSNHKAVSSTRLLHGADLDVVQRRVWQQSIHSIMKWAGGAGGRWFQNMLNTLFPLEQWMYTISCPHNIAHTFLVHLVPLHLIHNGQFPHLQITTVHIKWSFQFKVSKIDFFFN